MTARIVFTGGGTAGHVIPNLSLIEALSNEGWQIDYIGSANGVEAEMVRAVNIPFHSISSGKLRRYVSWKNLVDPFKILWGIWQSWRLLRALKPHVVFSKGGFVAVPVVIGAWLNAIPVIAHESDISPGLANRLSFPFVKKICLTFSTPATCFKNKEKIIITGTPIRQQLLEGQKSKALALCKFQEDKPCLLIIGGSLGAQSINRCIRAALTSLCKQFQVIHVCGKGKIDNTLLTHANYQQFEYVRHELADFFAASDIVITRSGANSLYEILSLNKAHILIPLSRNVSRGDQIENALYFQQQGVSYVIDDDKLTPEKLMNTLNTVIENKEAIIESIKALKIESATTKILGIIKEQADAQYAKIA